MTAKQFYSPEGQRLQELEAEHTRLLNKAGYYSRSAAVRGDKIAKLKEKIEKLYPSEI